MRSFLTSLLWGTPKVTVNDVAEDLEADDSQDLTFDAEMNDQEPDSPILPSSAPVQTISKGWNDPPAHLMSAPSSSGTFGRDGPPPGAFGLQQQESRMGIRHEREASVASNTTNAATDRLEEFFRVKKERGEGLTSEEAVDIVRLVGEGKLSSSSSSCWLITNLLTYSTNEHITAARLPDTFDSFHIQSCSSQKCKFNSLGVQTLLILV